MKNLCIAAIATICLYAFPVHAMHLSITGMVQIGDNGATLLRFHDDSHWIVLKSPSNKTYLIVGRSLNLESEDPQPGYCYNFVETSENWNLDVSYYRYPLVFLSYANGVIDEPLGNVSTHQIIDIITIPNEFIRESSVILLDDGRKWIIPTYQNTFKIGDEVSTFTESESLVYLIKTVKMGKVDKEIFLPSKRLTVGVYQVF